MKKNHFVPEPRKSLHKAEETMSGHADQEDT